MCFCFLLRVLKDRTRDWSFLRWPVPPQRSIHQGRVNGIQLAGAGSWKGRKSDQVKRETLSPAELTVCERASEKESAGAFDICIRLQRERERERGGERTQTHTHRCSTYVGAAFLCVVQAASSKKTGKSISSLTLSRTPLFPVLPAFVSGFALSLCFVRAPSARYGVAFSLSLSHAHTNSHFPRKQFSSVTHKKSCLGRAALRRVVAVEEGKRQTTNTERGKRKGNGAAAAAAAAIQKKKGHVAHSRLRRKACVFVAVRMCVGVCGLSPFRQL